MRQQVDFVEPHVVGLLGIVAIHLEGNVDLFLSPIGLCRVVRVDGVGLIANRQGDVVNLIAHPFQIPYHVNPSVRRKVVARHRSESPHAIQWVPDVPGMALVEVALTSPGPARAPEGLVNVKLEGLRTIPVIHIEPEIVGEMAHAIAAPERHPIQLIRVAGLPTQAELCRRTV